jgi:hypothetical protein
MVSSNTRQPPEADGFAQALAPISGDIAAREPGRASGLPRVQGLSAARSPPTCHQMALRLGDAFSRRSQGDQQRIARERLYVQSVETISDCICKRAGRRDSIFAGCDTCSHSCGARDGRQDCRGWDGPGIEKVAAVRPAGSAAPKTMARGRALGLTAWHKPARYCSAVSFQKNLATISKLVAAMLNEVSSPAQQMSAATLNGLAPT